MNPEIPESTKARAKTTTTHIWHSIAIEMEQLILAALLAERTEATARTRKRNAAFLRASLETQETQRLREALNTRRLFGISALQ